MNAESKKVTAGKSRSGEAEQELSASSLNKK